MLLWHVINGEDHGFNGDVLLYHKDGWYHVGSTCWIDKSRITPFSNKEETQSFVRTLRMGYTHWSPLLPPVIIGVEKD